MDTFDIVLKLSAIDKTIKEFPKQDNSDIVKALKYVVTEQMKANNHLQELCTKEAPEQKEVDFTETNRLLTELLNKPQEDIKIKLSLV